MFFPLVCNFVGESDANSCFSLPVLYLLFCNTNVWEKLRLDELFIQFGCVSCFFMILSTEGQKLRNVFLDCRSFFLLFLSDFVQSVRFGK